MIKSIIFKFSLIFFSLMFSSIVYAVNGVENCPMNDGKIDVSEISNIAGWPLKTCDAPASSFSITVHALALCESDPMENILGNTTVDPCFYLWNTASGDSEISFGVTTSSETSFPATLPPSGVYTHGYGLISATIPISVELEFDEQKLYAGNSDGTNWDLSAPRSFVGGGNRSMSMKDFADGNYYGFTEAFSESQSSFNNYSFTYNSVETSSFVNRVSRNTPNTHNGALTDTFLLNNDNNLASSYGEVTKILVLDEYATPFTITDSTSTITYKYSPTYATRVTFSDVGGGNWLATSILFGGSRFDIEFD